MNYETIRHCFEDALILIVHFSEGPLPNCCRTELKFNLGDGTHHNQSVKSFGLRCLISLRNKLHLALAAIRCDPARSDLFHGGLEWADNLGAFYMEGDDMAIALVTGSSTGIGLATVLDLGRHGYKVYASMRNPDTAADLRTTAKGEELDIHVVQLDVTDSDAVTQRVDEILADSGAIDVLVNNAGIGGGTSIEETPDEFWTEMFETNVFGAMRVTRAVLPNMRKQGSGTIVNVSSVAGRSAIPPQGAYSASKFALEAASEVLAQEVLPHGIRVAIIEPGVILTPIFQKNLRQPDPESPYQDSVRHFGFLIMKMLQEASQPDVVSEVIREAIETDAPRLRYPVGAGAAEFISGRRQATDEEWIEFGGMSDEEWLSASKALFGIDFSPSPSS